MAIKKWQSEQLSFREVTVDNLVCKDCLHKLPKPVSKCKEFDRKPNEVLTGGKCTKYEKRED